MQKEYITIPYAIAKGQKQITLPLKIILLLSILLPIGLIGLLHASLWYLLIFPFGLVAGFMYDIWATPKWKIWAYEHVQNIHQLQRSAELEGLLTRQSHNKIDSYLNFHQKEKLVQLQQRFLEDEVFCDDDSVSSETVFYRYGRVPAFSNKPPLLVLNEKGIQFEELYIEWAHIINERIARITHDNEEYSIGKPYRTDGSKDMFRYETDTELYEISLTELSISAWKLDYLLYIYRGRSNYLQKQSQL